MRILLLLLTCIVLALPACGAAGATAKTAVAVTAQSVQLTLKQTYEAGQWRILEDATTREEFDKNVGVYRTKWQPVWKAYDVFADAYNGWVDAEGGNDLKAFGQMRQAYCDLKTLVSVKLPELPGPVACGGT